MDEKNWKRAVGFRVYEGEVRINGGRSLKGDLLVFVVRWYCHKTPISATHNPRFGPSPATTTGMGYCNYRAIKLPAVDFSTYAITQGMLAIGSSRIIQRRNRLFRT